MSFALYHYLPNAGDTAFVLRPAQSLRWLTNMPTELKDIVGAPDTVDVFQECELQAHWAQGKDAANTSYFSEFSFVIPQLHSGRQYVFLQNHQGIGPHATIGTRSL